MSFKQLKNLILIIIISFFVLVAFKFVLAQENATNLLGTEYANQSGLGNNDPRVTAFNIIRIGLGFLGIIAVIIIMYAGWIWMTAGGSSDKIDTAKKILIAAVIGLIIILASFAIVTFLLSSIFKATGGGGGGGGGGGAVCGDGSCNGIESCSSCSIDCGACGGGGGGGLTLCDSDTSNLQCDKEDTMCDINTQFCGDDCYCHNKGGLGASCDSDPTTPECEENVNMCQTYLDCKADQGCKCYGAPVIEWVSPVDDADTPNGKAGNLITISGRYFGTTTGEVYFNNNVLAPFPNTVNPECTGYWTDNQIIVIVPNGATDGDIKVVRSDTESDTTGDQRGPILKPFDVNNITRAGLCLVEPNTGAYEDPFTLHGINFTGTSRLIKFGGNTASSTAPSSNWTPLSADGNVPNITNGGTAVYVRMDDINSNGLYFNVFTDNNNNPVIEYVDPVQGGKDQYITIYGRNFLNFKDGTSKVSFNAFDIVDGNNLNPNCKNSWWHDKYIIVKVPAINLGSYNITVTNSAAKISNDVSFNVNANPPTPGLCQINPGNGILNTVVMAYGDNFGNNSGQAVFYENNAGSITSWNNTTVNTKVPLNTKTGPFKIQQNALYSNSLPFSYGKCSEDSQCDGGLVCCPSGTYWSGICKLANECAGNAGDSGFGWSFSTSPASTTDQTCSGFSNDICASTPMCPNAPGQCSTNNNQESGQACGNSFCDFFQGCGGGLCNYDSAKNLCIKTGSSCDSTDTNIKPGYTARCMKLRTYQTPVWQIDPLNTSCTMGGAFMDINGWCTLGTPANPTPCILCSDGLVCSEGTCAVSRKICPLGTTCNASNYCQKDNPICECCCRVSSSDQDCCVGTQCISGPCGAGEPTYGFCGNCARYTDPDRVSKNNGKIYFDNVLLDANNFDQYFNNVNTIESDKACNCKGANNNRYCQVTLKYPSGICADKIRCDANPNDSQCTNTGPCPVGYFCNNTCYCERGVNCDNNNAQANCQPNNAKCPPQGINVFICDPFSGCICAPKKCESAVPGVCDPTICNINAGEVCDENCFCITQPNPVGTRCDLVQPPKICGNCNSLYECINANPFNSIPGDDLDDCKRCCCKLNQGVNDTCTKKISHMFCAYDSDTLGACHDSVPPADFGICCGCKQNSDCGNVLSDGCSYDTCCRARPKVTNTEPPADGDLICRNTAIIADFDMPMNPGSFKGNVLLIGDYKTTKSCPPGTNFLFATNSETKNKNIFAKIYSFFKNIFNFKNIAKAYDEPSLANNYCAIPGFTSAFEQGTSTSLIFYPGILLDSDTNYYVVLKGDSDLTDTVRKGIVSAKGNSLKQDGSSDTSFVFNGIYYDSSYIWQFKTGQSICKFDHVLMVPKSYLFQDNKDDINENDILRTNETFDKYEDRDKVFMSLAVSNLGQVISPLPGVYNWDWSWDIANDNLLEMAPPPKEQFANVPPNPAEPNKKLIQVKTGRSQGFTEIYATATITANNFDNLEVGTEKVGTSTAWVFICDNPWPAVDSFGEWKPWIDNNGNCTSGACENYNYWLYYCRDKGKDTTYDDLPALVSDNSLIMGKQNATTDTLKDVFYFREDEQVAVSTFTVDNTMIGGEVRASWPAIAGTKTYRIYYGESSGDYSTHIDVDGALTTYIISSLKNKIAYYFVITSVNDKGVESTYSTEVSQTPTDETSPLAPINFTGVFGDKNVKLSWTKNTDDTVGYKIYYRQSDNQEFLNSIDVKDISEHLISGLNNGISYDFKLNAYDANKNISSDSNIVSGMSISTP